MLNNTMTSLHDSTNDAVRQFVVISWLKFGQIWNFALKVKLVFWFSETIYIPQKRNCEACGVRADAYVAKRTVNRE